MIEQTRFLSTVFSCSAFKLENIYSGGKFWGKNVCCNFCLRELILLIAGKSKKFRATRPANGIMVTLTNTPGWYLWTLVNTATKSDTDAYPIGGQWSIKIGIPKGMVFGPFGSENGFTLCPFWSGIGAEIGSGFGEPGGIPPPRNPRSTLCEDRHGAASLRENSLRNYPPYGWSKALVSWFLAGERAI